MKILRAESLGSDFTGSYKKKVGPILLVFTKKRVHTKTKTVQKA